MSAYSTHQAITPLDATILPPNSKGIQCLTAGNLVVQGAEAVSITYPMAAGQFLAFSARKVMTATTGTYALHR
jgi:hypothetical protein